jgi:hypothetical protein
MNCRLVSLGPLVGMALLALTAYPEAPLARPADQPPATATTTPATPEPLPDLVIVEADSDRVWEWLCPNYGPAHHVIDVRVANQGEGQAGHFIVRGEDGHPTPVPWEVSGLAAGEARWLGLREGGASVLAADADNEVAESNETNNVLTREPTPRATFPPLCSPTPLGSLTPTPLGSPTPAPFAVQLPRLER